MNVIDKKFLNFKFDENVFPVLIEISKGSKNKYEIDKSTGLLKLDRFLYTSTHYPDNYGYIPLTICQDGDALDVLIISSEAIIPYSFTMAKPIGILYMIDNGEEDYKVLAVSINDPFYKDINSYNELPKQLLEEVVHFFSVYKTLENKVTEIKAIGDSDEAKKIIRQSIDDYKKLNK